MPVSVGGGVRRTKPRKLIVLPCFLKHASPAVPSKFSASFNQNGRSRGVAETMLLVIDVG